MRGLTVLITSLGHLLNLWSKGKNTHTLIIWVSHCHDVDYRDQRSFMCSHVATKFIWVHVRLAPGLKKVLVLVVLRFYCRISEIYPHAHTRIIKEWCHRGQSAPVTSAGGQMLLIYSFYILWFLRLIICLSHPLISLIVPRGDGEGFYKDKRLLSCFLCDCCWAFFILTSPYLQGTSSLRSSPELKREAEIVT